MHAKEQDTPPPPIPEPDLTPEEREEYERWLDETRPKSWMEEVQEEIDKKAHHD